MKSFSLAALAPMFLFVFAESVAGQGLAHARDAEILNKLQGTWEVVAMERRGQPVDPFLVRNSPTVTFHGHDYTWGDGQTGRILAIDASKNPITIDYQRTSGPQNGQIDQAIIQIDGNTFMDCMGDPGQARPVQFTTLVGTGRTLMSYRRTDQARGPGLIFNPWLYVGICCGTTAAFAALAALITAILLWLSHIAKVKPPLRR